MNISLNIPESYKDITNVAIKGRRDDSDIVICTTNKKLMTFFRGYLTKSCYVDIEAKHLEPFVVYEPTFEVYYILYGDGKVVIVKEDTSLKIIKTYVNVYEMVVSDNSNSGIPQLHMKTDKGLECIDIIENEEQISNTVDNIIIHQETSAVFTFCVNKLQKLKMLYDTEKYKLSQKASSFVNAVLQVSNLNDTSNVNSTSNIITKSAWLKLSNENLVYGFTLQNNSKLPVSDFNIILLEDNKTIWSKFRFECWAIGQNKNVFNFHSDFENNCISNSIEKCSSNLNSDSSIIVANVVDDWSSKSLPYSINGIVYINNEKNDKIQYISTDAIMATAGLFLDMEFNTFVKNSVLIEDLITLYSTKLSSCYKIKCTICVKDLKNIMVNNFKFDTKHGWFVNSSLAWLRTVVCYLHSTSPFECILKVFSESLVYTKTFIQVFSTMLPEHTSICNLDSDVPICLNIDAVILDLKELRRVFKEYLNEQIIIPRDQWNSTRSKLLFT